MRPAIRPNTPPGFGADGLTGPQLRVWLLIFEAFRRGKTLFRRELNAALGYHSPNALARPLEKLEAMGLIERDWKVARSIRPAAGLKLILFAPEAIPVPESKPEPTDAR